MQLKHTADLFLLVLEDYSYPEIENAFKLYLRKAKNMPTPADIVELIEQNKQTTFLYEGKVLKLTENIVNFIKKKYNLTKVKPILDEIDREFQEHPPSVWISAMYHELDKKLR